MRDTTTKPNLDHMAALLLPFAKRLSDDELVSPNDVERGRACNCVCPGCKEAVLAKQGTERVWHFAHAESEKCAQGYEASIHELAKQMLRQRMEILLPSLIATASELDAYGRRMEEHEPVLQSRLVKLDDCKTGGNLNGILVDAIGILKGHQLLIEITVFHRLMPDKKARLVDTKIPCMQINLEQFKSMQANRALLEQAIFEDESIRQWIYHPKHEPALEKAQAKLDKRLQESKTRWERDEALRKGQAAAIKHQAVTAGWDSKISAAFKEHSVQRSSFMLSSAFPPEERISLSARRLAQRSGLSEERILSFASTYTNRGQLRGCTPESFAAKWCEQLGLPVNEVKDFLVDAGYLLRC